MAEKRKPALTLLLRKHDRGWNIRKIELFPESLWQKPTFTRKRLYRLRINGRWFGKKDEYYSVTGFTNILGQSIEALLGKEVKA